MKTFNGVKVPLEKMTDVYAQLFGNECQEDYCNCCDAQEICHEIAIGNCNDCIFAETNEHIFNIWIKTIDREDKLKRILK